MGTVIIFTITFYGGSYNEFLFPQWAHTDASEKVWTFPPESYGPAPSIFSSLCGLLSQAGRSVSVLHNCQEELSKLAGISADISPFPRDPQSCNPGKIKSVLKSAYKFKCLHLKLLSIFSHVNSAFCLDSKQ